MNSRELHAAWRARAQGGLPLDDYRLLGKTANQNGEALLAFDIAREGLETWANDKELRLTMALALARMGSTERARDLLLQVRNEGHGDEETLGLLARTYKDLWLRSGSTQDLKAAFDEYRKAYNQLPDRYWTGINAATLAFALRDGQTAGELAGQVLETCEARRRAADGAKDYWLLATMAEAKLIQNQVDGAEALYREARAVGRPGNTLSTWRNARILLRLMAPSVQTRMEQALRPPKVAVFEGDWNGDPTGLTAHLLEVGVGIAYSLARSDADLAFLEAMQSIGGQTYIVLPYNEQQFVEDRVNTAGTQWEERYRKVRGSADSLIVCSEQKLKFGNVGDEYAYDMLRGLAKLRAAYLDTAQIFIGKSAGRVAITSTSLPGFGAERRAMMFADAFRFSSLSEEQIPAFITEVMERIATLSRNLEPKPEYMNTWGDGLFFVFATMAQAGRFALEVAASVAAIDRKSAGLPDELALRIGLHAGPVYKFVDQITGRENYIGTHVNRAARIEPITPPGGIYASDAFAALASVEAPQQFQFDYVGRIPLAKSFGEFSVFELRAGR